MYFAFYYFLFFKYNQKMSNSDNDVPELEDAIQPKKVDSNGKPIDSDYYAWSKKMKESKKVLEELGVDCKPKKIESPLPDKEEKVVGSAWNKAGTWYQF